MSENPIAVVLQKAADKFNAIAPSYMQYEAEKGFAIQLLKNNSFLEKAAYDAPDSLQHAITNVAAIGLSLNPAEKLAYLIPRHVKVKDGDADRWVTKIFLEPSYMGLIRLATDSGSIEWAQAVCVYENDTFVDNGPGLRPDHKSNPFGKKEARGEFVGVYCIAKTKGGDYLTTLMPVDEVHSIRDRSESWKKYKTGPWLTDFNEQAKKSVIRRAFKTWPRTDERRMAMLANAIDLSNQNEGFEPILSAPALGQYTGDQKAYFDQLIQSSDSLGMFTFRHGLNDEAVFINLYHSFEKGQKGKYQRIVDELISSGQSRFMDIFNALSDACASGDDSSAWEVMESLPNEVMVMVTERANHELGLFLLEIEKTYRSSDS